LERVGGDFCAAEPATSTRVPSGVLAVQGGRGNGFELLSVVPNVPKIGEKTEEQKAA